MARKGKSAGARLLNVIVTLIICLLSIPTVLGLPLIGCYLFLYKYLYKGKMPYFEVF